MKNWIVGVAALMAGCGGAKLGKAVAPTSVASSSVASSPVASPSAARAPVAAGPATAAAGPTAAAAAPSPTATIATEPGAPRPAPGQLTAGIWDDNLNFLAFGPYADAMRRRSIDLAAFTADEQRRARDELAQQATGTRRELDIQLVLDTTGSMGDELAYLQSELDSIAQQVHARFPAVTPRWSLVVYKDRGDAYTTRPFDFTTDTARFRRDLAAQAAGGGGDFPEAVIAALEHGLQQRWRPEPSVAKLILWVADAPPHPGEGQRLARLARQARRQGVRIYPIASSGIDDGTEYQMRATAQLTGGRYVFLTDDSGIGNPHAQPHIPCYSITRLDHAIVRIVESELTGRRAPARPEQVIRRVGNPDADGTCRIQDTQLVAF